MNVYNLQVETSMLIQSGGQPMATWRGNERRILNAVEKALNRAKARDIRLASRGPASRMVPTPIFPAADPVVTTAVAVVLARIALLKGS